MNEISNVRKNVFKKGSGFSKYDRNGNVVYSESIGRKGETVRHFYNYDDIGRRIYYKKVELDSVFEESIDYYIDGSYIINTSIMPEHTFCKREYNSMGRIIKEVSEDREGNIAHKVFDPYRNRYNITKTKSPFEYIL